MVTEYRVTQHDKFMRCMDCGHATVGLYTPYQINHAEGCGAWRFEGLDGEREAYDVLANSPWIAKT